MGAEVRIAAPALADDRYSEGERLNVAIAKGGKRFVSRFIEPGLVAYPDKGIDGFELLPASAIEEALQSIIGQPLTRMHPRTTRVPVPMEIRRGVVEKAYRDADTGFYVAEGAIDQDSRANDVRAEIAGGFAPSCGYTVLEYGPGGTWHGIPYFRTISKIRFHHLAVVPEGRYEAGDIRLNSAPPKNNKSAMSAINWFAKLKKKIKDATGAETEQTVDQTGALPADASVQVGTENVRLNELVDGYRANKAATAKAADSTDLPGELNGDTEIEVDGERVRLNDLVSGYEANKARTQKTEAQRQADADAEKKRKDQEERERANDASSFRILANASTAQAQTRIQSATSSGSREEGFARGRERYSSIKITASGKN